MEKEKEQMLNFNQESQAQDKSFKFKMYNYFYLTIKSKGKTNSVIVSFFIVLETIQIVSYAFSEPHLDTWKLNKNAIKYISIILGSMRISPLMKYVSYNNINLFHIRLNLILLLFFHFCN